MPYACADIALLDPPWYNDHLYGFLWAACAIVGPGGHVLAVLPPVGTRPGIAAERARLLAWCATQGLQLLETREAAATYLSPLFEVNALRAAGIPAVPKTWRRGDLCVFRKADRGPNTMRPSITADTRTWREWTFGPVRIRVRSRERSNGDPRLIRLVPGDVLPSVSRRDVRRDSAAVWTSGNRIFDCQAPDTLAPLLSALEQGIHSNGADVPMLSEAFQQARRLIDVECEEVANYFEQAT